MRETSSFADLPQRLFLDSSTLQTMHDYGGYLYENEPISRTDQIHRDKSGIEKLEGLRLVMQVAERAPFQFALSDNSFREVQSSGRDSYLQWAYDVLDHWHACLEDSGEPNPDTSLLFKLESSAFGYLGVGDRSLLKDAIALDCDAFLTMENKLPKNAGHIQRELGLRVLTPASLWRLLAPWAALFR